MVDIDDVSHNFYSGYLRFEPFSEDVIGYLEYIHSKTRIY